MNLFLWTSPCGAYISSNLNWNEKRANPYLLATPWRCFLPGTWVCSRPWIRGEVFGSSRPIFVSAWVLAKITNLSARNVFSARTVSWLAKRNVSLNKDSFGDHYSARHFTVILWTFILRWFSRSFVPAPACSGEPCLNDTSNDTLGRAACRNEPGCCWSQPLSRCYRPGNVGSGLQTRLDKARLDRGIDHSLDRRLD